MTSKENMDLKDTKEGATSIKLFKRAEVANHNHITDAWIIIDNNVYNVTSFLDEHPGGEEVLMEHAGKDGTEAFEDIGHSTDAREMMQKLKIGELTKEEKTKNEKQTDKDQSNEEFDGNTISGSWRSWLIPIALGVLATLVYRYFVNAH